jgi:ribosomal-protein-alanine N-acetyltransferase
VEGKLALREGHRGDVASLVELQRRAPGAAPWLESDYESLLSDAGGLCLLAEDLVWTRVAGFLLGRVTADEMEILNLAVAPGCRRRGVARRLLGEALARGYVRGARQCWLEVRASNLVALAFYQALNFSEAYRRRRYYRDPVEDAVVCRRRLDEGSGAMLPSLRGPA